MSNRCVLSGAGQAARRPIRRRALGALGLLVCVIAIAVATLCAAMRPLGVLRTYQRLALTAGGARFLERDQAVAQRGLYDCGPAALASLLHAIGRSVPPMDSLLRLTHTTVQGSTLGALDSAAAALGLTTRPYRFTSAAAPQAADLPLIAWVDRAHFVVVVDRGTDGTLTVLDPAAGSYRIAADRFRRRWSGEALVLIRVSMGTSGSPNRVPLPARREENRT